MTSVVKVSCVIHGDHEESCTKCSFLIQLPIRKVDILENFPFDGDFHFRLKVPGRSSSAEYYWLDISDSVLDLPSSLNGATTLEIQALILYLPDYQDYSEIGYSNYLDDIRAEISSQLENRSIREVVNETKHARLNKDQHQHNSFKSINKPITLQSVTEGATSLWKLATTTVKATATQFQQSFLSITPLTDMSESNLATLCDDLDTPFDSNDSTHLQLLKDLWNIFFPDRLDSYQLNTMIWKEAGWQTVDPTSELKTSGILALKAMIYFGNKFPKQNMERLLKNKANIKTNYPYAIVGVNLTLLLADLLSLKDSKYLSIQSNYWNVFEDPTAFYELFCICFHHVDSIWNHRKAVRTDFGKIIGETKTLVKQALSRGPKNIQEFKFAASDEGMMIYDLYE